MAEWSTGPIQRIPAELSATDRSARGQQAWQVWQAFCNVVAAGLLGSALLVLPVGMAFAGGPGSVFAVLAVLLVVVVVARSPLAAAARAELGLSTATPGPNPGPGRCAPAGRIRRLQDEVTDGRTWRELAYSGTLILFFTVLNALVLVLTLTSCMFAILPVITLSVAPDTVQLGALGALRHPADAVPLALAGLFGIGLCFYLATLLPRWRTAFARLALAPPPGTPSDVVELTRSRARLVNRFDDELRRIERDLHDGAQQRLLAVSLTLQLARMELATTDQADGRAAELVERADEEARLAVTGLRELIQGIHPQVLTDRGLAVAARDLAMHTELPVSVDVDLGHRLPGQVEIAGYYLVSEALTNVTKHSSADRVAVHGRVVDGVLTLAVRDDGVGGANPENGSGLRGLADRIAAVRGRLTLISPPGGPTTLIARIPCAPERSD